MSGLLKGLAAAGGTALVLTGLAAITAFGPIAADVRTSAAARLKAEGRDWARLAVDGRDVTVTGVAPEPADPQLAAEAVDRVFGVRIVADRATVLPLADPWVWTATLASSTLTATGAVPSEAMRTALAAAARKAAPDRPFDDRATLARGAPRDFADSATRALAALGELVEGSAEIGPAGLTLTGRLADWPSWRRIETSLKAGDFGKIAADRLEVPVPVPYELRLAVADGRLTATGFLPAAVVAAFDAAAKAGFPAGVASTIDVAPGAPAGHADAAGFALEILGGLNEGRATLGPAGLALAGRPKDRATWRRIENRLAAGIPGGVALARDDLEVPVPAPYRLTLTLVDGRADLDGFLPDAAARATLAAALAPRSPRGVADRTEIAAGAPPGFADAAVAAWAGLARVADPGLDLVDRTLTVRGGVPTAPLGADIAAALKTRVAAGYTLAEPAFRVLPPPPQVAPPVCEAGLAAVQAGDKIRFEVGSATLAPDGLRILDALVAAALRCLDARIVVEGHTDSDGDPDANRALSEARAAAVVERLVAAGLAAERLSAIGYGETRPVASNDDEAGKQQNRRIEFRVEGGTAP
ncbi:OmpA family protein [Siculibacillus lacustris]|uniref:OmpA family protein n=1 Tax=Siculibacillus lacustris TaxID=1549641 RepID=A0A4Q9VX98_9HYPH|nr:OmpA family protein [Siculibacillus lacustris]TBW39759.1 OmpA family protein [Siculibacillus lacustris]